MTLLLILWALVNLAVLLGGLDGLRWEGPNGRRELPPPTNQKGQDGN